MARGRSFAHCTATVVCMLVSCYVYSPLLIMTTGRFKVKLFAVVTDNRSHIIVHQAVR